MEGKQEKQYGGRVLGNELYHLLALWKSVSEALGDLFVAHRFLRIAAIGPPQGMLERVFSPAVAFRACRKPNRMGERGGYCPRVVPMAEWGWDSMKSMWVLRGGSLS